MIRLYGVGTPTTVVMKPLFALLVAAVVVIGTAPVGAAVASPADLGSGPAPAQTEENETPTSTPPSTDAEAGGSNATPTPDGTETVTESDANESNGTEPGAQLAGVLAVQGTEVESEVGSRAFGQRVAAAASNDSKAAVVSGEVNDSRERLAALRERLDELEAAREAGNISQGRYRANTAQVAAEINAVERRLEQSNDTAASLPADVRAANGINTSNIERLRTEARNLSGPEVAAIARSIGGDRSGRGLGDNVGPPGRSGAASGPGGPPDDAGNGDAGPPANRTGNGSGSDGASDRGPGDGANGDRGDGSGSGENPQESEANRNDRENGGGDGSGSGDSQGSGSGDGGGSGPGNDGGSGGQNQNGNSDSGGSGGGPPGDGDS